MDTKKMLAERASIALAVPQTKAWFAELAKHSQTMKITDDKSYGECLALLSQVLDEQTEVMHRADMVRYEYRLYLEAVSDAEQSLLSMLRVERVRLDEMLTERDNIK